ncbi:ABC transporter permease [Egicoccus sp. AB-alg2]|uniref:ABC transporter permease n=1 Tax=Egicoccus sp. AB-alg2 TaxID=3242693 RepID=UPI00359F1059
MRAPVLNPVLRRELLERWRGRRAAVVLTVYLGVLGGLLLLARWLATSFLEQQAANGWTPITASGPVLGRFLLENLLAGVLGLVLFIAPGYAAAQLAGERERRTLGLLRITLLRPWNIVLGKLGAASAWSVLLVLVTAPLAATAFVLGGATLGDLLKGLLVVVVVAVSVAAMAIGISARTRRTTGAVVLTYGLVLVLVIGTLIAAFAEFAARDFSMPDAQRPVAMYANPFYALADASGASSRGAFMGGGMPSVLTPFAAALPNDLAFGGVDVMPAMDVAVGFAADGAPLVADGPGVFERNPVWPITLVVYVLFGFLGLLLATRSLGPRDGVRET